MRRVTSVCVLLVSLLASSAGKRVEGAPPSGARVPEQGENVAPVRWSMLEVAVPADVEFAILPVHPEPGIRYSMQGVVVR